MIDKMANSACYFAIGNYTLPKTILNKKGEYTESEKENIKKANINGAAIIKYNGEYLIVAGGGGGNSEPEINNDKEKVINRGGKCIKTSSIKMGKW